MSPLSDLIQDLYKDQIYSACSRAAIRATQAERSPAVAPARPRRRETEPGSPGPVRTGSLVRPDPRARASRPSRAPGWATGRRSGGSCRGWIISWEVSLMSYEEVTCLYAMTNHITRCLSKIVGK